MGYVHGVEFGGGGAMQARLAFAGVVSIYLLNMARVLL